MDVERKDADSQREGSLIRVWLRVVFLFALAAIVPVPAYATPTFLSAINISAAGQDAFEPQVVVDPSGNVIAVWTRFDGSNLRIQSATRTPSGPWSTPVSISDPGFDASTPRVAVDPSGNVLAVWTRNFGATNRIQASYRLAGGSFGAPVTVSSPGGTDPSVSMDNSGKAVLAWSWFDSVHTRVQATTRTAGSGGTFGTIQTLSGSAQDAFDLRAAAGPSTDSNGVVIWALSDGTNYRVQSSRRRDVPGFARPKGATPGVVALAVAYNQCTGAGNRTHGPALAGPACNPPASSSSVLTVGTGDANGFTPNFAGNVRFDSISGSTGTEVDEADVRLKVTMSDIRNKPSGSDYTGRVLPIVQLQITDNFNSDENPEPGTTQVFDFQFPIACTATGDTGIGSTCDLTSTADSFYPGAVLETKRTIWQLGQVRVMDAGPNGTGYASCPPTCGDGDEATFLRQGIWVP
jgi:hypothetical protein